MAECTGLIGSIFGHKFKPRYSKSPSIAEPKHTDGMYMCDAPQIVESYRQVTYIGDVCVRCGESANIQKAD